jgi:hypothetical protein
MSDRPTSRFVRATATLAAGLVLAAALAPATVAAATKSATKPATALAAATRVAAASSPATATIPLAKGEIAVQLWPSTASSLLLVSLTLPETVQLPARVRMPLPQGATVTWSGEIIGGDAAADVQRQYTIVDTGGGRAIEFVAQQSRDLQYEADLPVPAVTGSRVMTTLKWVQTTDALGVDPAVKLPAGATDVLIKPTPSEQPRTNTAGEALYTLPQQHPALGGDLTIEVTFQQGAATTTPSAAQPSGTSPLVWVFLLVLVVVVAVVVVQALRAGLSSPPSDED